MLCNAECFKINVWYYYLFGSGYSRTESEDYLEALELSTHEFQALSLSFNRTTTSKF